MLHCRSTGGSRHDGNGDDKVEGKGIVDGHASAVEEARSHFSLQSSKRIEDEHLRTSRSSTIQQSQQQSMHSCKVSTYLAYFWAESPRPQIPKTSNHGAIEKIGASFLPVRISITVHQSVHAGAVEVRAHFSSTEVGRMKDRSQALCLRRFRQDLLFFITQPSINIAAPWSSKSGLLHLSFLLAMAWLSQLLFLLAVGQATAQKSNFYVRDKQFYRSDGTKVPFLLGVNIGITKPAHFPSEKALSYSDYLRYFGYCTQMHANSIRVYTSQPPAFYRALRDYNTQHVERPLLLLVRCFHVYK